MERAVTALAHHVTSLGADVTNAVDLETADNNPLQQSRARRRARAVEFCG